MSDDASYAGSCHCGAIGFTYRTKQDPSSWTVRACQCSFCRAHNVVTTSDPAGSVEFVASNRELLNRYRFGERTADFLVCRQCGVYLGAVIDTPGGRYGIVNINALSSKPRGVPGPKPMEYGAESKAERISRRALHWSPVTNGSL